MIYITGDTHGDDARFRRFRRPFLRRGRDYCVVCGDFGFVWDGSPRERAALERLSKLDCVLLFVEGTHDNLDRLREYPEEDYLGGKARRLGSNLLWLRRGDVFDLGGVTLFALGGGVSRDADERVAGVNWWPDETPSAGELARARENLARHGNRVDLVVTHHPPGVELGLLSARRERANALDAFLDELNRTLSYRHWYFGDAHLDRAISSRMTAVFEKIRLFDDGTRGKQRGG